MQVLTRPASQGRVGVLGIWFTFLTAVVLFALWSYRSCGSVGQPAMSGRQAQQEKPAGMRRTLEQKNLRAMDGRLLVRAL